MKKNNTSKKEKAEIKKNNLTESQSGSGLFLFQNKSNQASLQLPKTSYDGKKWIEPNQTWQGDSFFFKLVPREAILVKTIISPDQQKKEKENAIMNEEKLILDQPDQVTTEGKIEHLVSNDDVVEINENSKKKRKIKNENSSENNKLLTEDPIAGVTIIRD
jgi:hypothetical protein